MKRGPIQFTGWMAVLLFVVVHATAMQKPNIVIILADDMGYGDCGVYNPESKIATPHIDQLAKEGLRFTDAHAASVTCTPSRYGLLTGISPDRTGVYNTLLSRGDPIIDEDEKTIAAMLRDQGYATHIIGKWHLGFDEDKSGKKPRLNLTEPLTGGPVDRGFDSFFGIASSPGAAPLSYIRGRKVMGLPTEKGTVTKIRAGLKPQTSKVLMAPGFEPVKASPAFCSEAIKLIREQAASDQSRPLFLYYASPIPHQPWVPTEAFKGKSGLGDYGDFMMQLDDVVGQINHALKETGLDKNTLLIFTSDNGAGPWAVKAMELEGHDSSGVLQGSKASSWEGGHRVPFIAKWPGQIPANNETGATINFTDMFATLAELLEVEPVKSYPGSAADSVSFLSVLHDPAQAYKRPGVMVMRGAIRAGDWKLVPVKRLKNLDSLGRAQFGLYNLAEDLSEQNDVSKANPERVDRLVAEFKKFAANRELK